MIQTQRNYLEYVQKVQGCLDKYIGKTEFTRPFAFPKMIETLSNAKLLVPVVGGFSSGKSTLINSFLGKEALPVGIKPETALATEIHFSEKEKLVAMKTDGQFEESSLNEFSQVTENAKNYKSMKVYLNQPELKNLYPLVLVDMPGFDSPLDTHNKAILEYLYKGSHYIFLVTVEDGNITQSMQSQIIKIQESAKTCSFFLSKSNLKSPSEVQEVKEKIEEQIQNDFDFTSPVVSITQDGGENLKTILKNIDREKLFESHYLGFIRLEYYEKLIGALDTTIQSLSRDENQNDTNVKELKKEKEKIEEKQREMKREAPNKYADTNVGKIVHDIGSDVSDKIEEIVQIENPEERKQRINDIFQESLIRNLNSTQQKLIPSIQQDYCAALTTTNSSSETKQLSPLIKQLPSIVQTELNTWAGTVGPLAKITNLAKYGSTMPRGLIFASRFAGPAIAIAVPLLTMGISSVIKNSKKEKIRIELLTQVIPDMKNKIERELSVGMKNQIEETINEIGESFKDQIQQKQEQIQQAEEERKKHIKNIEQEIQKYKQAKQEIESLAIHQGIKK